MSLDVATLPSVCHAQRVAFAVMLTASLAVFAIMACFIAVPWKLSAGAAGIHGTFTPTYLPPSEAAAKEHKAYSIANGVSMNGRPKYS